MGGRKLTDAELEDIRTTDPQRWAHVLRDRKYRQDHKDHIAARESAERKENAEWYRKYNRLKKREQREREKARHGGNHDEPAGNYTTTL